MLLIRVVAPMLLLVCSSLQAAELGRIKIPDFSHLQAKAVESVDVTIGPFALWLAQKLAPEETEDGTEIKEILQGIEGVHIRSYEFEDEGAYSRADVESVSKQLRDQRWTPLVEVRDRKNGENVDIFMAIENDMPVGFALVAQEPRQFTIINIVGSIDPRHLAKVQASLDLPGAIAAD